MAEESEYEVPTSSIQRTLYVAHYIHPSMYCTSLHFPLGESISRNQCARPASISVPWILINQQSTYMADVPVISNQSNDSQSFHFHHHRQCDRGDGTRVIKSLQLGQIKPASPTYLVFCKPSNESTRVTKTQILQQEDGLKPVALPTLTNPLTTMNVLS